MYRLVFAVSCTLVFTLAACDRSSVADDEEEARVIEPANDDEGEVEEKSASVEESEQEQVELEEVPSREPEIAEPAGAQWHRERLVEQPRMEELIETADPDFANPQSTEFAPSERDLPDSMIGSRTAVDHLYALGSELRLNDALGQEFQEQSFRLTHLGDDEALGVIAIWGMKDDAVVGNDLLVHLERDDGMWFVSKMEERFHCLRGVDGGRCL